MAKTIRPFSFPMKSDRGGETREWLTSDTKEMFKKNPKKGDWANVKIQYKFNGDGYRCDDFEKETDGPRILFSGCSITEGIGLKLEDVWSHRIYRRIEKELDIKIPYWSIAFGGSSLDHQHRALFQQIPKLKPDVLFFQLPELSRRERWDGDYFGSWSEDSSYIEWSGLADERYITFQTSRTFDLIENLLQQYKTKCYILTSVADNEVNPAIDRKVFFSLIPSSWRIITTKMALFDYARDGFHHGPKSQKIWASDIWDEIKDEIPSLIES